MKRLAKPRSWDSFQHYKDRRPPWIKLHRALLDDRDFQRLPVASRALAPMLWLIASESADGTLDVSIEELTFRLRQPETEIRSGLQPLIDYGFIELLPDASGVLAERLPVAVPEERRKETEAEREAPQAKPAPALKPKRQKAQELHLNAWIEQEKQAGRKIFGDYKPLWDFVSTARLPREWIEMAWIEYKKRYTEDANLNGRKQADWRQSFLNHIKNGYAPKLWAFNKAGEPFLTDVGIVAQRELEAQEVAAV